MMNDVSDIWERYKKAIEDIICRLVGNRGVEFRPSMQEFNMFRAQHAGQFSGYKGRSFKYKSMERLSQGLWI